MKILSLIEDHPYMTGGVVLGVGVFLVIILARGDGAVQEVSGGPSMDAIMAANNATNAQLTQAQLAAQVAAKQSDNALYAAQNENSTALAIATKQFETQQNSDNKAAQVAIRGYDSADLASTLEAATAQLQSNNETAVAMRGYDSADFIADRGFDSADLAATLDAQTAQKQAQAELTATLDKQQRDYEFAQSALAAANDLAITNSFLDTYGSLGGTISVVGPNGQTYNVNASAPKSKPVTETKTPPKNTTPPKTTTKPKPSQTATNPYEGIHLIRRPHHGEGGLIGVTIGGVPMTFDTNSTTGAFFLNKLRAA